MRKLGRFFSFIVYQLWRFVPWSFNKAFGHILASLWVDVFRIRTRVIDDNIKLALPELSADQRKVIARQSMATLCRGFFDVFKIPSLTDKWIEGNVVIHGQDVFDKIRQSGSGCLILTLHFGSGDLAAAILSRKILPLSLISKRFKSQWLDEMWFDLRGRSKTQFIDAHSQKNAFDILSGLKQGRGIIFVLDQFMGKPFGVATEFFGRSTGTAYGLALFAKKTKKPVVPVYNFWDQHGRYHIHILEPIDLSHELSETNEVVTNRFNRVLETIIRHHPEHWMWVHRRWKKFE